MNYNIMKKVLLYSLLLGVMLCSANDAVAQRGKRIRISNRKAKNLVQMIKANPQIETLYLFRNGLDSLPGEIGELKHLKRLVVSSNRLSYIPPVIGNLTNLEEISFKHNRITSLPPEIGKLINLKELYLDYNQLDSLPKEIGNLKDLEILGITNNKLIYLPDEIGGLRSLEFLYIGTNLLHELPASLGNLTNLIELNIANSGGLLQIPESIENCHHLERLYVDQTTLFPFSFNRINPRLEIIIVSH